MPRDELPPDPPSHPTARLTAAWPEIAGLLQRFFRRHLPSPHVDDAVQDTYLQLREYALGPEPIRDWHAVALFIAGNMLKQQRRDRKTQQRLDQQFSDQQEIHDHRSPERLCIAQQEVTAVREWFEQLSDREKFAFDAATFEDESAQTIARQLNNHPRTVQRIIKGVRNQLSVLARLRGDRL